MFPLPKIIQEIEEEAEQRFLANPACPGGKTTKIYDVIMEIDLAVGELMRKTNERRVDND